MSDRIDIPAGDGVRLRIEGLRTTLRAMEKAGADAENMRELMHEIGMTVVHAASAPVLSGALAGTGRAGRGKTKAVARWGTAAVPYAGPIHYGWPARNIDANPFAADALAGQSSDIFNQLDAGIGEILRKNNLA